jgi:YVTN family beta-propeller protein
MTQPDLVQLAQSGDAGAIAVLMNSTLQTIGVTARVALRNDDLHILLESDRVLAPQSCLEFVRRGIARLGLNWAESAVVYSRLPGQPAPTWVEQLSLTTEAANPFFLSPDASLEVGDGVVRSLPVPPLRRVRLFDLLLLSFPFLLVLSSIQIWNRYFTTPVATDARTDVLTRLNPFQTNPSTPAPAQPATQPDPLDLAVQRASRVVQQQQTAQSHAQWRSVADGWLDAIAQLEAIPADHPRFQTVQQKLEQYRRNLAFVAKDRLSQTGMELVKVISGGISPKSVVYSGKDLFFAQNMMYSHTITVYDREYRLVKTISDAVKLADYGYSQFPGQQQGAPVEAAFSQNGKVAWISNYQMYGTGFNSSADDTCSPSSTNDPSFLYRIGTDTLHVDQVVQVGAVPKYVAVTPNNRYVLVSNWCSWDVSVVDTQKNKEIRRIQLGPYPRGIAIDRPSEKAYVAVMGSYDIAVINLKTFAVNWLKDIGHSPRHLNLDPAGKYLYATLNGEGQVAKIDLSTGAVMSKVATGSAPRSMTISDDGQFVYVVNYDSDTVSKVRTRDMKVVQTVSVNPSPIGITYDPKKHQVWVACYSGSILVFQE